MCFNCGDFIDMCTHGDCTNPNGGAFNKYAKFYVGSKYCEHKREEYGHDTAEFADRYGDDE